MAAESPTPSCKPWCCWPQSHCLVTASLPLCSLHLISPQWIFNLFTCFALLWFGELSSEFGSWLIHQFAVFLLKSSKWDFRSDSGPRGPVFLTKLTVSCVATRRIAPRPSSHGWIDRTECKLLLLYCKFTCGALRTQGHSVVSLLRFGINPVCTPGKTKLGVLLRGPPRPGTQTGSRSAVLWKSGVCFDFCSVCSSLVALPMFTTVSLYFPFASGDWRLWPRETPWRLQLQVPVFP